MDKHNVKERMMKYDLKNNGNLRLCSVCKEWKDKDDFGAQTVKMKNGQKWTGLRPDCKDCHNKSIRANRRLKKNNRLRGE